MKQLNLLIGAMHISVKSASDAVDLCWDPAWAPFVNICEQQQEIFVKVHLGIPDWIQAAPVVFTGLTEENKGIYVDSKGWEIRESNVPMCQFENVPIGNADVRIIVVGDKGRVEYAAVIGEKGKNFHIYCAAAGEERVVFPVIPYPLGPLMLYYMAVEDDAALMHASGVVTANAEGFAFSALSGTGKSTMARLWEKQGARIVNDDRLLLRIKNSQVMMYNSPMPYPDVPKFAPLHTLCLIRQSKVNEFKELHGAIAVARVYAQFIQHAYDESHLSRLMTLAEEICSRTRILEVGFSLDGEIVKLMCYSK
jgi:hypothetical protein